MNIEKAINCLKNGEIIIYPTESSYAFGADANNKKAIEKLKKIKNQPADKPIHVIISDLNQIKKIGIVDSVAGKLSKKFHPGQINLIIDCTEPKKYSYLSEKGLAFRVPKDQIALKLCRKLDAPITTTSANIHGEPAIYDIKTVKEKFKNKVCEIVDAGNLDESIPVSTIYDTRTKKIIREGPITKKEIDEVLK